MRLTASSLIKPSRFRRALARCLCLLLACIALAQTAWAAVSPLQPHEVEAIVPDIEAYVRDAMREWQVPGVAIGIVADDKLVYAQGFGVRRHGGHEPVDADTVFQMGSTTKAFLGVTLALLVDGGTLRWTDRVVDHVPTFQLFDPWVTREFQVADLLAQRSGLPFSTLTNMMLYDYPRDAVIRALRFVEPVSSFRSTFAYQNAFHLVAGELIARVSGAPTWEHYLQTAVLDPLGMTSTGYTAEHLAQSPHWARGHRPEGARIVEDPLAPFPYNAGGAGNLNSNVRDMSRWLRFQINAGELDGRRLLSADALRQTHAPRIALDGPIKNVVQFSESDTPAYATGWIVHATPQGRMIEHGGGTAGYTTHLAFEPDRRFGVVVLTNLSVDIGNGLALPVGKYIVDRLQQRPRVDHAGDSLQALQAGLAARDAQFKAPERPMPARSLEDYAGVYDSATLGRVTLAVDAQGLLGFELGPRRLRVVLTHWSGDVFLTSNPVSADGPEPYREQKRLRFLTDERGVVSGFEWNDAGDGSGHPAFWRVGEG